MAESRAFFDRPREPRVGFELSVPREYDPDKRGARDREFADSPLEGTGFEPPVPQEAFSVVVTPVAFAPNFALPGNRAEVR